MNDLYLIEEYVDFFRLLELIMHQESDFNWISGIRECIRVGELALNQKSLAIDSFQKIKTTYHAMYDGPGSFGDFYVWRESWSERLAESKELNSIIDRLWNILK